MHDIYPITDIDFIGARSQAVPAKLQQLGAGGVPGLHGDQCVVEFVRRAVQEQSLRLEVELDRGNAGAVARRRVFELHDVVQGIVGIGDDVRIGNQKVPGDEKPRTVGRSSRAGDDASDAE